MLNGSCHCGQLTWSYHNPLQSVTACNCTLCRRYGTLWAYGHLGDGITISGETSIYLKGEVSEFHFCNHCGCVTHYLNPRTLNDLNQPRVAVNMRLVESPEAIQDLAIDHFDGLVQFEDLPPDHRCVRDLWF